MAFLLRLRMYVWWWTTDLNYKLTKSPRILWGNKLSLNFKSWSIRHTRTDKKLKSSIRHARTDKAMYYSSVNVTCNGMRVSVQLVSNQPLQLGWQLFYIYPWTDNTLTSDIHSNTHLFPRILTLCFIVDRGKNDCSPLHWQKFRSLSGHNLKKCSDF